MSIKRFFGKTTSEALRKVRDALGSDGVILSNRAADGGVEILALSNNDMTAMIPPPEPEEAESAPQAHQEQQAERVLEPQAGASSFRQEKRPEVCSRS